MSETEQTTTDQVALFVVAECVTFLILYEHVERYFQILVMRHNPAFHRTLLTTNTHREYFSNAPAVVHAVVATGFAVHCLLYKHYRFPSESFTYFIYDLVQGVQFEMQVHHVLALLLIALAETKTCFQELVPFFTFTEISTIYLCLFIILRGTRKARRVLIRPVEKIAAELFRRIFIYTFFLTRIILLLYPIFVIAFRLRERFVLCLVIVLYGMNFYWFNRILILSKNRFGIFQT